MKTSKGNKPSGMDNLPKGKKETSSTENKQSTGTSGNEELLNPNDQRERVHVDLDNLSTSRKNSDELIQVLAEGANTGPTGRANEGAVPREDQEALDLKNLGDNAKHNKWPVDFAARDLDVRNGAVDNKIPGKEEEQNKKDQ